MSEDVWSDRPDDAWLCHMHPTARGGLGRRTLQASTLHFRWPLLLPLEIEQLARQAMTHRHWNCIFVIVS